MVITVDKIRDINQYIDTVKNNSDFFKQYYFHSLLDLNLVKLDYILKYGILSKKLIHKQGLINLFTHNGNDIDSKNGENYVSLSEYTDNCEFSTIFESFSLHTLTSLSLLVNKSINTTRSGERETYFDDEVFCLDSIPKDNIEGIILPEHLSNMQIKEINCLPNDLYCYTKRYINNWLFCMEKYFEREICEKDIKNIKESLEQLWSILKEYESPEKWLQLAIQNQRARYGKDLKDVLANVLQKLWRDRLEIVNPNFTDVLMSINKNNFPVYEIKQKSLQRIN